MPRFNEVRKFLVCEIYEVPADILANCDRLEGHPNWYCRTKIGTLNGRDVEAYTYLPELTMAIPQKDIAVVTDDTVIFSFA